MEEEELVPVDDVEPPDDDPFVDRVCSRCCCAEAVAEEDRLLAVDA
jgi:hypothetical protein